MSQVKIKPLYVAIPENKAKEIHAIAKEFGIPTSDYIKYCIQERSNVILLNKHQFQYLDCQHEDVHIGQEILANKDEHARI